MINNDSETHVEYGAQVKLAGEWYFIREEDNYYFFASEYAREGDWFGTETGPRLLINAARSTTWTEADYRIVKRYVTRHEIVEQ